MIFHGLFAKNELPKSKGGCETKPSLGHASRTIPPQGAWQLAHIARSVWRVTPASCRVSVPASYRRPSPAAGVVVEPTGAGRPTPVPLLAPSLAARGALERAVARNCQGHVACDDCLPTFIGLSMIVSSTMRAGPSNCTLRAGPSNCTSMR